MDCFDSFLSKIRKLPREQRLLLPCTVHMCKVLLVNPATTSTAEQSFSTARRIKTRMRSKMIPVRFNTLSILHTQKTLTDNLNLKDIANIFCGKSEKKAFNLRPILNLKKGFIILVTFMIISFVLNPKCKY